MANYTVQNCLSGDTYIVSAISLSIGEVISFYYGEETLCGTVLSESVNPPTPSTEYIQSFENCCDCVSITFSIVAVSIQNCVSSFLFNVDIFGFCVELGFPQIGSTYLFSTPSEPTTTTCGTVMEYLYSSRVTDTYPISGPYLDCNCQGIPRSANTENFVCVTCCPCDGSSGSTFSVTPPHPVWTDGYGTSVTQMNMIVIGGINGLNG